MYRFYCSKKYVGGIFDKNRIHSSCKTSTFNDKYGKKGGFIFNKTTLKNSEKKNFILSLTED